MDLPCHVVRSRPFAAESCLNCAIIFFDLRFPCVLHKTSLRLCPICAILAVSYTHLEESWYYEYVGYVYENGLFSGTSDTTFEPETLMTRAMFVQLMANFDGVDLKACLLYTSRPHVPGRN